MAELKHSLTRMATMLYLLESNLSCMTTNYGDRLSEALKYSRKDRIGLSRAIDISVQAIGQVMAGKTKALTAENTARAARYLGVDFFWLATGEGDIKGQRGDDDRDVWPFENIPIEAVRSLTPGQRRELEASMRTELRHIIGDNDRKIASNE